MFLGFPVEDPKGTVSLTGYMDVPRDRYPQVKAALEWHITVTRREPGCKLFEVKPCPDVEYRFLVNEKFVDQAAFDAHQERAANSAWAEVTKRIPRHYEITVVE